MSENYPSSASVVKRLPPKTHQHFGNYHSWKHKLRDNCFRRIRDDRSRLLWRLRQSNAQSLPHQEVIKSAFQDIVCDELNKIKDSPLADDFRTSNGDSKVTDVLWEYAGLEDACNGDCEEILLEMQRIFYENLREEQSRKGPERQMETWEDEEDEYLARAVFEHMQLTDGQVKNQIWCPICKHGALQENHRLIYCSCCQLQLNKDTGVNLELLCDRLAEAHASHFDQGCRLKPKFSLENRFGLTALYIICEGCNMFEVVI